MTQLIQSIVYGIVQGIGEFLPISSTAHLILVPYFTGWPDQGLSFDVALHIGTLIAVIAFFWKDWWHIVWTGVGLPAVAGKVSEEGGITYGRNIFWLIIIATVPGVIAGTLLERQAETAFRNPLLVAVALAGVGGALFLADKYAKHGRSIGDVTLKDALFIGLFQACAIVPGVSRSGATIIGALARKFDRESAARFSFLLSTPIIFGAAVKEFPSFMERGVGFGSVIAIAVSAVSGFLAIKYLLKLVSHSHYRWFFWYRLGLAAVIVAVYLAR